MIDDTQPHDVKDELEIPATATESSEDVPPVGATYKSQELCAKKWEIASRLHSSISSTQLSSTQPQLHGACLLVLEFGIGICLPTEHLKSAQELVQHVLVHSGSNWNLAVLVFEERAKPEYL